MPGYGLFSWLLSFLNLIIPHPKRGRSYSVNQQLVRFFELVFKKGLELNTFLNDVFCWAVRFVRSPKIDWRLG